VEVEGLIEAFREDCRLRGMSEEAIRRYVGGVRNFVKFVGNPLKVTRDDLKSYLDHLLKKGLKAKTIENEFSAISAFYDYLAYEGYVEANIVPSFRKRYLRRYKRESAQRKLASIEDVAKLVNSIIDPRDRAIVVLLAKTGIRRQELIDIDVDDIDWEEQSIRLKPKRMRSNRIVFFDDECALVLKRWMEVRERLKPKTKALFINYGSGRRIDRNTVYKVVTKHAARIGLHDPKSKRLEDHFGPHCLRHWFTTWLIEAGMPREYVKELRGDARRDAVDIYHHIPREELRRAYLAYIPKLGIV